MSRGFFDRLLGRGQRRGTQRVRRADASRRATTCSPPWPGSRRWSPPARSRRPSPRAYAASTASSATPSPGWPRLGAGSPQAYSVMATATDYLPEAVGGYLRLPRQFADNRPVDRGKSSLMVLIDQLDLLASTMDKVFDAVCRADAAALVAHGRFLAGEVRDRLDGREPRRRDRPPPADAWPRPTRPRTPATCGCSRPAGGRLMSGARPPAPLTLGEARRRARWRWRRLPVPTPGRARRGPGPRRRGGRVRAGGRATGREAAGRRQHPGLLRRRQPRAPLARTPPRRPSARWPPRAPRTPRRTPRRWPRSPRRPASSASRPCG